MTPLFRSLRTEKWCVENFGKHRPKETIGVIIWEDKSSSFDPIENRFGPFASLFHFQFKNDHDLTSEQGISRGPMIIFNNLKLLGRGVKGSHPHPFF